jgi:TonB family protein
VSKNRLFLPLTANLTSLALVAVVDIWAFPPQSPVQVTLPLKPLSAVRPVYPPAAKADGIEGKVTLRTTVDKDGSVSHAEVLVGDPEFAQAAIEAVCQWRYEPMEKRAVTDVNLGFTPVRGDGDSVFTSPMALYYPDPPYTKKARAAKLQGTVLLESTVASDGTVSDVKVTKALGKELDESAAQIVMTWKFLPALKDGNPVPFKLMAEIVFKMWGRRWTPSTQTLQCHLNQPPSG